MAIQDFFIYSVSFSALAAGGSQTQNINIGADGDFIVQKQTYQADVAHAGQTYSSRTYPLVNILITDTGSGRQLMDQAVPLTSFFGTGEIPFILPQPKVFAARSNIQVQAINFDAAQTYNFVLSFVGVKQFK